MFENKKMMILLVFFQYTIILAVFHYIFDNFGLIFNHFCFLVCSMFLCFRAHPCSSVVVNIFSV